jgi:hypothetical protein
MSRGDREKRQDPFRHLNEPEPVDDMTMGIVPSALRQPGRGRGSGGRRAIHPSELRRRRRQLSVTFSDASIPSRLRALAREWGLETHNGAYNVSSVVECLLLPLLEAAEQGEINLETGTAGWKEIGLARVLERREFALETEETEVGGQWF